VTPIEIEILEVQLREEATELSHHTPIEVGVVLVRSVHDEGLNFIMYLKENYRMVLVHILQLHCINLEILETFLKEVVGHWSIRYGG
jgi:hypothetical protein